MRVDGAVSIRWSLSTSGGHAQLPAVPRDSDATEPKKKEIAFGNDRNYYLARLLAKLATGVEMQTGSSWRNDKYTFEAVRAGIDIILSGLCPEGEVEIPDRIKADIASKPEIHGQFERSEAIGAAIAFGILDDLKIHQETPPINHPSNKHYSDAYFLFPLARKALDFDENYGD